MQSKNINIIGWAASIMTTMMYFSYVDQIINNLSGHYGSLILPIITTLNCSIWTIYGVCKIKRDWPIIACNVPGIMLGLITAITTIPLSILHNY